MEAYPITMRLGRPADAPTLAAMSRDLVEHGLGWQYRPDRIRALLRDPDTVTPVACRSGRIAGFAIMKVGDERAHIVLLAVRETQQRRSIGRRLIAWLMETAATAGIACVHVELRADNEAAYALYRATGFSETLRLRGYYAGRETAIRMLRLLRTPGTIPQLPWPRSYDQH